MPTLEMKNAVLHRVGPYHSSHGLPPTLDCVAVHIPLKPARVALR